MLDQDRVLFSFVGTYSPFKSIQNSLQRGASLQATCKAACTLVALCTENQRILISSPNTDRRNVIAYGEPLLSKGRQAFIHCVRLVELANKKATGRERLQSQQNRRSPGGAGQRLPVVPAPCTSRAASPASETSAASRVLLTSPAHRPLP